MEIILVNNNKGVKMEISQHSKGNKKYIIFSAYRDNLPEEENHKNHKNFIRNSLKKEPYKILKGVYKGKEELSILTRYTCLFHIEILLKELKQRSILVLENYKHGLYKAYLKFSDNSKEDLGYFREVSKEIALKQESYTIDNSDGTERYYICTKSNAVMANDLYKLGLKE